MPEQESIDERQTTPANGAKVKREKKVVRRRGRSIAVNVTLSGEVKKWAQSEADANFRTLEGQIAYCVAQAMAKP